MEKINGQDYFLVADIGGTNSNLALIGREEGHFQLLREVVYPSKEINGIVEPLLKLYKQAQAKWGKFPLSACCVSAAGPVRNGVCRLTNARWLIDINELKTAFKIPIQLVNDFVAITSSLELLDLSNPETVVILNQAPCHAPIEKRSQLSSVPPPPKESTASPQQIAHQGHATAAPPPEGSVRLVLGAGTGLGVGFSTYQGNWQAHPSEGGQADFSPFNAPSARLRNFLVEKLGRLRDEDLISGNGLANIYSYLRHCQNQKKHPDHLELPTTKLQDHLDTAEPSEQPKLIGQGANKGDKLCETTLAWFAQLYGQVTARYALLLLPKHGIFLAGGVTQRYQSALLKNQAFMKSFTHATHTEASQLLKTLPVYLIREYSTSLYGAAVIAATAADRQ